MDGQRRDLAKILTAFIFLLGYIRFTHAADGDVRLRGGAANSGRVEVEYSNQYGTVCLDAFDIADAHVVCRQLGFRYGALRVVLAAGFGFGQTGAGLDINVHSVNCAGDEANLAECPGVMWSGSCDSSRAAAVFCALPHYEGCYEKDTLDRIADNSGTLSGSLNLCRLLGNKNNFAASSSSVGTNLICLSSQSEFGTQVDDSFCEGVCVNNPNQICGGVGNYRAVYSIRLGADGFSLTGDSSSITSPNYPASYDINDRQEWTVTLTSPQQVEFSFPAFDLLSGDVITISAGGVNETFPARRTWLSDSTSSFTVWFESGTTKGNGFILNYDVYVPPVTISPPQPPATTQDQATQPPPPVTTADSSIVTTDGETATTAAPPPPPPTTKGVAMSTAAPQQPSTGVVQPAATTGTTSLTTTSSVTVMVLPILTKTFVASIVIAVFLFLLVLISLCCYVFCGSKCNAAVKESDTSSNQTIHREQTAGASLNANEIGKVDKNYMSLTKHVTSQVYLGMNSTVADEDYEDIVGQTENENKNYMFLTGRDASPLYLGMNCPEPNEDHETTLADDTTNSYYEIPGQAPIVHNAMSDDDAPIYYDM